jgi:nucleoside-diphosphate-sugar epimerase
MNVILTGSTGFIGSHVLSDLLKHGHEVTALVRDDNQAARVAAIGPTPAVADFYDRQESLFRRALEDESARGRYVAGDGSDPSVAELTQAAAVAVGAPGAAADSEDEARARLGDAFAEVLLLDQSTDAAKARAEFGWHPAHPNLVEEFRNGSYRT